MDIKDLKQFIIEANGKGYASGEKTTINETDGLKIIKYRNREWKMVDNYVGWEPYSGMTKIFFQEKIYLNKKLVF